MNSDRDTRCRVGCPIRRSRDHRSLASPPGFSQRATSFIASQCQGIHQMPFFALVRSLSHRRDRTTAAHRAKPRSRKPVPAKAGSGDGVPAQSLSLRKQGRGPIAAVSHEDTSRTDPVPGTRACPPRSHHQRSLHPSINPGTHFAGAADRALPRTPPPTPPDRRRRPLAQRGRPNQGSSVVEVNGLEPMTSCLQSRRSPS
jgi:hypothetical protein